MTLTASQNNATAPFGLEIKPVTGVFGAEIRSVTRTVSDKTDLAA